ncbi:MAG: phage portal protein [Pyrinomonadaceae bacterium MAG19_C2-C3]|nr:phage portal protein [Pyrinomonadaceae bacterium MAG19_C2-C3]
MNIINSMVSGVRGTLGSVRSAASDSLTRATRHATVSRALNFYNGLVPPALRVKVGEPDDNVYINYAEIVVDKGVEFLFGEPLKISVGTDEDARGEEYLERVYSQAQRDEEFQEMAQDGATSGDAYLEISIGADGTPRVSVGDPNHYEIETFPHDVSRVMCFRCVYPVTDATTGKEVLFKKETTRADDGLSWTIRRFHSFDGGNSYSAIDGGLNWNRPFAPVYHAKNLPNPKVAYGKPDLTEPVLKLIAYISRLDSMCGKTVRVHSSPKPYAKGLKKQDLEWGTDGMLFLKGSTKDVDTEIGLLEMKGDLAGALSLRRVLREGLAEMTGVPEIASGKLDGVGNLSGLALRILYAPLIAKTRKKQLRYGRMIRECIEALMQIGGITGEVKLHWADALPGDEKEKVEVAEGKLRVGFSKQTVIASLGGDPTHEQEQRETDAGQTGRALVDALERGVMPDNRLLPA